MEPLSIRVACPSGNRLRFTAEPYVSDSKETRYIEQAFYDRWSGGGFDGLHHELVIDEPRLWKYKHAKKYHFHQSTTTGRYFVCWTGHLPDEAEARKLFACWSLATAYTIETLEECPPLFPGKLDEYIELLAKEGYRIA